MASVTWSGLDMKPEEEYIVEISANEGASWSAFGEPTDRQNMNVVVPDSLEPGATYQLRIRTERGHVSTSETFTVAAPPALQSISESISACAGERIVLRAEASGTNISYRWTLNGRAIDGARADSLVIESLDASTAGTYTLALQGSCKPELDSDPIIVTMAAPTAIVQQPVNQAVQEGEQITLSVLAEGDALQYQWTRNDIAIDGATSANYVIERAERADAGTYACVVRGTCGEETSETATVEVDGSVSVDVEAATPTRLTVLGPIPASTHVRVRLSTPIAGMVSMRLVDGQGATALVPDQHRVDAGVNDLEIPVHMLASGQYGLEATIGGRTMRVLVLITR